MLESEHRLDVRFAAAAAAASTGDYREGKCCAAVADAALWLNFKKIPFVGSTTPVAHNLTNTKKHRLNWLKKLTKLKFQTKKERIARVCAS